MSRLNLLSVQCRCALFGIALFLSAGMKNVLGADPAVKVINEKRAGKMEAVNDASVTRMNLNAKDVIPCLFWADKEGKAFFTLEGNGIIRKISFPEMVEEQQLDLEQKCSWLSPAPDGLLLTVSGKGEVQQLDATLNAKRSFKIAGVRKTVAVPTSGLGVAATADGWYILDLKRGGQPTPHRAPRNVPIRYESLTLSPDGKRLFATDGDRIMRFGFTLASNLKGDFAGPDINAGPAGVQLSPDGKHIALPASGGNRNNVKLHPEIKSYSTYVYATNNLTKPEFVLESGAYPQVVGFDPVGGFVFAQNSDHQLIVFTYTGIKKKEYTFDRGGTDVRQFLPHPSGNKLLVLTDRTLAMVELPPGDK